MYARLPMTAVSGARLGPYEILAPLGKGGMGEVYRAKDTRLGREVAIKVLPEAFACDPDRVARFRREAQLLASFNHPNIAAIYEFDEAKGTLFLVMELVPGQTLKQMLLERPLSVGEALPVACQIAEALEAAHAKGVLHRDLKPANVKVTPEKKVKLLDFGLAKAFYPATLSPDTSQSPTVPAEQTQQGMVVGTAAYMSPEQARGKTLDERSDVWSFGCVLFEMLSGQKAFGGDTLSDILVAILERQPDWDALPPETPPAIVELLKLALKKNVNERLESIADARSVIEDILTGGTPVVARPRTSPQPVSRSLAERPGRLLMLTALLALAGVAAWVGLKSRDGRGSLPKEKYLVVLPFKDLTGQAEGKLMGAGMAEHLSAVLARAPGVLVMPAATGSAPANEGDLQRLAQERGANLFIRASVQREGERMRVAYSLLSSASPAQLDGAVVEGSASDVFGLEDRLAEKVLASLRVRAAEASPPTSHPGLERPEQQIQYLQALGALQRYDDPKSLESAIDLLSKIPGGTDSALVQAALGRALLASYGHTKDSAVAERARQAVERAAALDPSNPEVRVTRGQLLTLTGRPQEAVGEIRKALEAQPDSAEAVTALGQALQKSGDLAEAERIYLHGVTLRPTFWGSFNKLGAFYVATTKYDKAIEAFQKAIALNPESAALHSNLGASYMRLDRFEEARAALQKSIEIQPTNYALSNLGTCLYLLGRYEEAASSIEKAIVLTPKNFKYRAYLGDALTWAPGQAKRAAEAYRAAVPLGEEELRISPRDAAALTTLARCRARLGEKARAWEDVQRALVLAPDNTDVLKRAAIVATVLGKREEAFRLLERAVSGGYGTAEIERDPDLASLRGDPRFKDILSKSPTARKTRT